ncbi:hypothetical protein MAR_007229 [Mya arenaria]|uniref:Uncharacterized protein n=1 Tax=Mya arenaria TaxID=6604 RepID=A0ABY7DBV5_MYAAR|nr:hypothetical protein MAR_007229 [Mya arenaria]
MTAILDRSIFVRNSVPNIFETNNVTPHQYKAAHCAVAKKYYVIYKMNINECWKEAKQGHLESVQQLRKLGNTYLHFPSFPFISEKPTSSCFEQMCLAEFAHDYRIKDRSNNNRDHESDQTTDTTQSKVLTLQNNLETIVKRNKPAVIRNMNVNKDKNAEDYYHNLLRVYYPHGSE